MRSFRGGHDRSLRNLITEKEAGTGGGLRKRGKGSKGANMSKRVTEVYLAVGRRGPPQHHVRERNPQENHLSSGRRKK